MERSSSTRIAEALDTLIAAGGDRVPDALTDAELAAVNAAFGTLRRCVEAAHVKIAAEVARRSTADLGRDSFARRQGFRSPPR